MTEATRKRPLPTLEELKLAAREPGPCPLCERPNRSPSDHHLVPRARGGKETLAICRDCHDAIHATFSNKELEREYATVEALLSHEGLAATIRHIAKQDGRVRTRRSRTQRDRRRNG